MDGIDRLWEQNGYEFQAIELSSVNLDDMQSHGDSHSLYDGGFSRDAVDKHGLRAKRIAEPGR
jgi:hypothetical protein